MLFCWWGAATQITCKIQVAKAGTHETYKSRELEYTTTLKWISQTATKLDLQQSKKANHLKVNIKKKKRTARDEGKKRPERCGVGPVHCRRFTREQLNYSNNDNNIQQVPKRNALRYECCVCCKTNL